MYRSATRKISLSLERGDPQVQLNLAARCYPNCSPIFAPANFLKRFKCQSTRIPAKIALATNRLKCIGYYMLKANFRHNFFHSGSFEFASLLQFVSFELNPRNLREFSDFNLAANSRRGESQESCLHSTKFLSRCAETNRQLGDFNSV